MKKLTTSLAALCLASGLGLADTVSVQGTASGYDIHPTGYMTAIGFNLHPGGYFRFSYSYSTNSSPSTGTYKLESLDDQGNVLDTLDLNPVPVYHFANALGGPYVIDEYVAAAQGTRNGTTYQVMVDLVDRDGGTLPDDPANYLDKTWDEMYIGVGIDHPDCQPNLCEGFVSLITSMSAIVTPEPTDADGDGVPDSIDRCSGSANGAVVNADGCSIAQLVPCSGPTSGGSWKSHGQYVSALSKVADTFVKSGLITEDDKDAIVAAAAGSSCGGK